MHADALPVGRRSSYALLPVADGESESHVIGAEEAGAGFERATHKRYAVYSRDLGALKRVNICQLAPTEGSADEEGAASSTGWYLDRVEVRGPEGERWTFPCGAWLGKAGDGPDLAGCVERNLIPADHFRDVHASSLHDPTKHRITRPIQASQRAHRAAPRARPRWPDPRAVQPCTRP